MDDPQHRAVLAYRVGQLEKQQATGFARVEAKLDAFGQGFVSSSQMTAAQQAADLKHAEQDKRLDNIDSQIVWVVRIIIGAVIGAVLTLVIKNGT